VCHKHNFKTSEEKGGEKMLFIHGGREKNAFVVELHRNGDVEGS
jgi:hypothetical protein